MKWLRWVPILALLLLGSTAGGGPLPDLPLDGEPRNVRLRGTVATDSLVFRIQWNAPQRGRFQTPIEGYEWELWSGAIGGGFDSLQASGATPPTPRRAEAVVGFDCSQPTTFYTARVRATGNFSSTAPWGVSNPFLMECDDSPPGPPLVDLDTIPMDPATELPLDSLVLLPVSVSETVDVAGAGGSPQFHFNEWGGTVGLCAIGYRAELPFQTPWSNVISVNLGGIEPGTTNHALWAEVMYHTGSACWNLTAQNDGWSSFTVVAGAVQPVLASLL
jgi:hypothetical protein